MATKKISEFTTLGSLSDNDILPVVSGGANKKITASVLKTYAQAGGGTSLPTDAAGFLKNDGTGTLSWASAPATLMSPNGTYEVTLDDTGALVLSSYGVVKNLDHVNMVSDGWVQMQWVDTNTLTNADPNATSGPTNWIYVDQNGIHVETNINGNINDSTTRYDWNFDIYGNLQMPVGGDIKDSNGNSVLGGSGSGFSGNYNDLTNTPFIPTSLSDFGITAGSNGQVLTLNSSLTPVWTTPASPFSGSYNDLTDKPTLPGNEITNTDGQGPTWSVSVSPTGVISMTTARGGLEFGAMPEVGGPTHLHIMRPAGQEGSSDLYFGDDYNYVKLPGLYGEGTQGVEIASSYNGDTPNVWRFETYGQLTVPGAIHSQLGSDLRFEATNLLGGGATIQFVNRDDATGSKTTQLSVTPDDIELITDFSGANNKWTFNKAGHIVPGSDILQDIGTPTNRVRHIYVGPGSITIGDSVLSESTTGKLVVPGLTRATSLYADEVEDTADQTYVFATAPVVIDAALYDALLNSLDTSHFADYTATLDGEGYIDNIQVNGSGTYSQAEADIAKGSMYAYVGTDSDRSPFVAQDWMQIPFRLRTKANDVEYEFSTNGGGASNLYDLNDVAIDGPSNGQVLTWNSNQEKWENQNPQGGGNANTGNFVFEGNSISSPSSGSDVEIYGGDDNEGSSGVNLISREYAQLNYSSTGQPNAEEGKNNYVWVDDGGATIQLWADQNNGDYNLNWTFGTNGTLQLPTGGQINFTYGGIRQPDGSSDLIVSSGQGIRISTDEDADQWIFDTSGNLTLPVGGDIKDSNGNSVLGGSSGSTTKTWTNPNSNTWRIEEYSGGWAGGYNFPIAEMSYTLVESQTDVNYFFIDTSAYPEQWQAIQWAEEYVINGVTVSASGYGVTSFPNYNISLGGNVTYSSGDTVTIRYRNRNASPEAEVWWDAANSPSGNSDFRGAIIEYHAYCGNSGTAVGKIIIACDNNMSVSHEEALMGGDMAQYEFWMQGDTGQLKVRRIGTDSNNNDDQIWIQWTGKIFYGSDYYC